MPRKLWLIIFILVLSAVATAQMKSPANVGIDEKLGSTISLDTPLKDEDGNSVTLRQYVDKPTILMFNYFRCPGICPVLINNTVDVINRIQSVPGKDYRVIAVSFDPADTAAVAREKKANYLTRMGKPFSPDDWHFLTGSAEDTKAVADSAGFNYRQQGDMFVHPGALILLTPKGVISRYLYGTSFVPADVEIGIQEAAGGQVLPTISRALAFCYVTDPQGRGRVFSITRFVGAVTLVIAAVFVIVVLRSKNKGRELNS
jgi:protein SCO1